MNTRQGLRIFTVRGIPTREAHSPYALSHGGEVGSITVLLRATASRPP